MYRNINKKAFSFSRALVFVFFLFSIRNPAEQFVWAQAEGNQASEVNETYSVQDISYSKSQRTVSKTTTNDRYMLIPGGDAIGIKIQTDGLIVVDTYNISTESGEINPAKEAGILKGDVIIAVNDHQISTVEEYRDQLVKSQMNGSLNLKINRLGQISELTVKSVINTDGVLTTGLYLRDKIAGIGTLSYIDPNTNKYGALGHEIIDQATNQLVEIHQGEIINSNVTSIRKAKAGNPGEKIADILFNEKLGTLEKNNQFGIYGIMQVDQFNAKELMPIAYVEEVQKGKAQILTVLNGTTIEAFDIEITEINFQVQKAVKGIKYKVTDKRLLDETGGIVQGMSGSPIIQNGKIIGAVTHVLVHDSTMGYGIFIEWMLQESEINYKSMPINQKVA